MSISVVTCTGDRKISLSLLSRWIKNQTIQPDQWLIVDDGEIPFVPSMNCDYISRTPQKSDPPHTLGLNLLTAIPHIKGDIVLFCEDDEYYAPAYIQSIVEKFYKGYEAVGICRSKYYNLRYRTYYVHSTVDHASLAQTAIKKEYLGKLKGMLNGDPFIDIRIWEEVSGKRVSLSNPTEKGKEFILNGGRGYLFDDGQENCLYVGMKGMPGRKGIGIGHKGAGTFDPNFEVLKKWNPRDYQSYVDLYKKVFALQVNDKNNF